MSMASPKPTRRASAVALKASLLSDVPYMPLSLSRYGGEYVVAGNLTATASLGAHPAVFVVGGVLLTLLTTQVACFGTSMEGCSRYLRLEGRLSRHYPARGVADVGAVEVEPYAASERLGVLLPRVCRGMKADAITCNTDAS
jgi:hypothetical protein